MELRYPIGYNIKAEQIKDGNWRLEYTEKFRPEDYEAFSLSVSLLKSLYPDCKLESDRLSVIINGTRNQVLDFLAGEFLFTSGLGGKTLAELLSSLVVKGLRT